MREFGGVAVDEFAVVGGEVFSCCLVFGEVPTGGEFGLQGLVTKQETPSVLSLFTNTFLSSLCQT